MSQYSDKQYIASDDSDRFYYSLFFKKGDKILDIGCSTGNFIAQDAKNITGIDSDDDAIKIARKRGFRVLRHDVRKKLPFKECAIGNINCRHVLEHLEDPLSFIKDIFRVLKKSGRLVLITDELTRHFWDDYSHKRPFTKKSMEQIAYDSGFRSYNVRYFPPRGVFGIGFLRRHKLVTASSAKMLYFFFGKLFKKGSLMLEAKK